MTINQWGDLINPLGHELFNLYGTRIYQSDQCVAWVPNKTHKKRRNQSAAYHKRIQKKWKKRFGVHKENVIYMMNNSFFGGHGKSLLLHPEQIVQLRNFI